MAHLIKPILVRYIGPDGKRCTKTTPGVRKVKERSRKWYGKGIPGLPPTKKVPLCSDKTAAQQMLAKLVRDAELGIAGISTAERAQRSRPLADHLADWAAFLRSDNVSEKQVALLLQRATATFDGCGFALPPDIALEPVLAYLAARRKLTRKQGGLSMQSSNFYLQACQQFCRWMVRTKPRRLAENPLADAQLGNVKVDRRHDRRALTARELLDTLLAAQQSPKAFRGLTGPDRYHLYLAACGTGFRVQELAALAPESFDLDGDPPTVALPARIDKAKRPVAQPIHRGLAATLRPYIEARQPGKPVWPGTWPEKAAKMLAADLAAASVPYVVPGPNGPLYADFHALRHTFVTLLERSGVAPKMAQGLARHGDITLTLNRYTHAPLADLGEAVQLLALPAPGAETANPLGHLSRKELETAVAGLLVILTALVAPRVVPTFETTRDETGRGETEKAG